MSSVDGKTSRYSTTKFGQGNISTSLGIAANMPDSDTAERKFKLQSFY